MPIEFETTPSSQPEKESPPEKITGEIEAFDPEKEIARIKSIPKQERRQFVEEFKEKFAKQKEQLAILEKTLIDTVHQNPDMPVEELIHYAKELSENALSPFQERTVEYLLGQYGMQREEIKIFSTLCNDNPSRIYASIFGSPPKGNISMQLDPVSIHFRCENLEDYAGIFQHDRDIYEKLKEKINNSAGVQTSVIPHFWMSKKQDRIIVTAENSAAIRTKKESEKVHIHEAQHAITTFIHINTPKAELEAYSEYISAEISKAELVQLEYADFSEKQKINLLARYFRELRKEQAEDSLISEIFSYFKEDREANKIISILLTPKAKGGLYDYFDNERQGPIKSAAREQIFAISEKIDASYDDLIDKAAHWVFAEEYQQLVADAVTAFNALKELLIEKGRFSQEATSLLIAYFMHEPITKWIKNVRKFTTVDKFFTPK